MFRTQTPIKDNKTNTVWFAVNLSAPTNHQLINPNSKLDKNDGRSMSANIQEFIYVLDFKFDVLVSSRFDLTELSKNKGARL